MGFLKYCIDEAEDIILDARDAIYKSLPTKTVNLNIGYYTELSEERGRVAAHIKAADMKQKIIYKLESEIEDLKQEVKNLKESPAEAYKEPLPTLDRSMRSAIRNMVNIGDKKTIKSFLIGQLGYTEEDFRPKKKISTKRYGRPDCEES